MSRSYEYSYALEAARRQALFNSRVSATTQRFYERYMSQLENMASKGYAAYIPNEMNRLREDLSMIRELLVTDPVEARDISFEVGSYIKRMSSLAKTAEEQFERSEMMRAAKIKEERSKQRSEQMQTYFSLLQKIPDQIVANYSMDELKKLRERIESGAVRDNETIITAYNAIVAEAQKKADEWKKKTAEKRRKADMTELIREAEERVKKEKLENLDVTNEFIKRIQKLHDAAAAENADYAAIEKQVSELETDVDDELVTEEIRRETVNAIIKQLRAQEFTVRRPEMIERDGKNYVKLVAQKPSGHRVVCNVDLHGKFAYRFDKYEGMACIKDIEKFNVELDRIYSVKLSDERVLWENPDKLSKDAETIPMSGERRS